MISGDIVRGEGRLISDVLIRDVPDEVLAAIDVKASRLGISRVDTFVGGWPRMCHKHRLP